MRLHLTGDYRNCSYINDRNQVVYRVETTFSLFSYVSTIKRAISNEQMTGRPSRGDTSHQFTNVARIKFNRISPSLIQFDGGIEHEMVFQRIGWRNDLGFTGSDGLEYKWRVNERPVLVRRDTAKTLVAHCWLERTGLFTRVPHMEIFPDGMHMVDLIIVT
ncbi:hypothetical protein JOM56_010286 [Amanita muscaria]